MGALGRPLLCFGNQERVLGKVLSSGRRIGQLAGLSGPVYLC